ncbi:MAG: hypothetical protein M3N43_08340 [Actinomycetota bacterium]|nr:hypothetical protein [Actinomycetota bacterium]
MSTRTGRKQPWLAFLLVGVVLASSFFLSASTWVSIGRVAGFDGGDYYKAIAEDLSEPTPSWALPVTVDGFLTLSLLLWLAPVSARAKSFAKWSTYTMAFLGVGAQSAYHALMVNQAVSAFHELTATDGDSWRPWLAGAVGAFPPAIAAMAVHMVALLVAHRNTPSGTTANPVPVGLPGGVPVAVPAPGLTPPQSVLVEPEQRSGGAVPAVPERSEHDQNMWPERAPEHRPERVLAGPEHASERGLAVVGTPRRHGQNAGPRNATRHALTSTGTPRNSDRNTATDEELLAKLATVPVEPDGTVPIRRAADALNVGNEKAKRLLKIADLFREPGSDTAAS